MRGTDGEVSRDTGSVKVLGEFCPETTTRTGSGQPRPKHPKRDPRETPEKPIERVYVSEKRKES